MSWAPERPCCTSLTDRRDRRGGIRGDAWDWDGGGWWWGGGGRVGVVNLKEKQVVWCIRNKRVREIQGGSDSQQNHILWKDQTWWISNCEVSEDFEEEAE